MPALSDLLSSIDSTKRTVGLRISDLLRNPVQYAQQVFGQLNDDAGRWNENIDKSASGDVVAKNKLNEEMFNLATMLGPGIISRMPAPEWNASRKFFPVGINPTRDEIMQLLRDKQSISSWNTLRTIKDAESGKMYAWPADAALHDDVGQYYKMNPQNTKHGLITP